MIAIRRHDTVFLTDGLLQLGMDEIAIGEPREDWQPDARALLDYVAAYVESSKRIIRPDETMNYGFWLIKFRKTADYLEIFEYNEAATQFVAGARLAMEFWRDQHRVCGDVGAAFAPPRPDALVAISPDFSDTEEFEGVRYALENGQSGWIITSKGFDGPVQSLRQEHLLHLVSLKRKLIRFVALPVGYRFITNSKADMWFDQTVAAAG